MPITEGQTIGDGQFTVTKVLRGGFSQILIVEDFTGLKRAIKCIHEDRWRSTNKQEQERVKRLFLQECLTWQRDLANCPHVAQASMAFAEYSGLGPVLFMEFVDGPSLQELREQQRHLSLTQTVWVTTQIAKAMKCAHASNVLHRDLKPSNVLLTRSNEVKLIDWGLSSARGAVGYDAYAPGYVSPLREADPTLSDVKDDIYAFGVIFYDCLTGDLPLRRRWVDDEIKNGLEAVNAFLPDELVKLLITSLHFDPDKRPNFEEIVSVLDNPTFFNDVQKRDYDKPFCACHFVSELRIDECPICGKQLQRRIQRLPPTGMVRVKKGLFTQGLSSDQVRTALTAAHMNNIPQDQIDQLVARGQRKVYLPAFDIDEYPVTNEQYDAFCQKMNYPEPDGFAAKKVAFPDHPVTDVTWKDALCYALWAGKRLVAPLEWEKAARGDQDVRPYPWGNVWEQNRCNNSRNIIRPQTTPVGEFTQGTRNGRSPLGVADMVGNVREWVSEGKQFGRRGLRGGGWTDQCIIEGLVSNQIDAEVEFHDTATGFRCAADVVYDIKLIRDIEEEDDAAI